MARLTLISIYVGNYKSISKSKSKSKWTMEINKIIKLIKPADESSLKFLN